MSGEFEPKLNTPERSGESQEAKSEQQEKLKDLLERGEKAREKSAEEVAEISKKAQQEAASGKDSKASEVGKENSAHHSTLIIDKALKKEAYKKLLSHVQRQLPKSKKNFSKFIHKPVVESVSELGSKTVARPSGLFAGGLAALIGSVALVWTSRHYGFRYNFGTFLFLLGAGFLAGLVLEWLWNISRKLAKH